MKLRTCILFLYLQILPITVFSQSNETNITEFDLESFQLKMHISYRNLTTDPPVRNDQKINRLTSEILNELLDSGYDQRVRPPGVNNSGPTDVHVSLFVRNIENINDEAMEYSMQATYRQSWIDKRLKFSHITSTIPHLQLVSASQRIWVKTDFVREKTILFAN